MVMGRACRVGVAVVPHVSPLEQHGSSTEEPCWGDSWPYPEDCAGIRTLPRHALECGQFHHVLYPYFPVEEIKLSFIGGPIDRLDLLVEGKTPTANLFTKEMYVAEQLGCRRILDTTFMMGFLVSADSDRGEVEKYFRALRRAQRDIDAEPERYKHYYLKELPERYHAQVDVQAFGPASALSLSLTRARSSRPPTAGWSTFSSSRRSSWATAITCRPSWCKLRDRDSRLGDGCGTCVITTASCSAVLAALCLFPALPCWRREKYRDPATPQPVAPSVQYAAPSNASDNHIEGSSIERYSQVA